MRSGSGIGHDRGGDRGLDFASKEAMIALDRGHDHAAIRPRSRRDRTRIASRLGLDLSAVRLRSGGLDQTPAVDRGE